MVLAVMPPSTFVCITLCQGGCAGGAIGQRSETHEHQVQRPYGVCAWKERNPGKQASNDHCYGVRGTAVPRAPGWESLKGAWLASGQLRSEKIIIYAFWSQID